MLIAILTHLLLSTTDQYIILEIKDLILLKLQH